LKAEGHERLRQESIFGGLNNKELNSIKGLPIPLRRELEKKG
jgi:hypothetical protein